MKVSKPIPKEKPTTVLKQIINKVTNKKIKPHRIFSDTRKVPGWKKSTGIKFSDIKFTQTELDKIAKQLSSRGYKLHYINYCTDGRARLSWWIGHRFCISHISDRGSV